MRADSCNTIKGNLQYENWSPPTTERSSSTTAILDHWLKRTHLCGSVVEIRIELMDDNAVFLNGDQSNVVGPIRDERDTRSCRSEGRISVNDGGGFAGPQRCLFGCIHHDGREGASDDVSKAQI
jgi:ribosomal protein S28E/S33